MHPKKKETFEGNISRLQEIINLLESPDISLEKGIQLYREGILCSSFCKKELETARHEISVWKEKIHILEKGDPEDNF